MIITILVFCLTISSEGKESCNSRILNNFECDKNKQVSFPDQQKVRDVTCNVEKSQILHCICSHGHKVSFYNNVLLKIQIIKPLST